MDRADGSHGERAVCCDQQQSDNGRRGEPGGFYCEAAHGIHSPTDLLLDEAVNAEGEGESECNPRKLSVIDGENQDRCSADRKRDPLQGAQSLAQDENAEQHGYDRVREVAQRRFNDLVGLHRKNVDQPVDENEDAGEPKDERRAPIAHQTHQRTPPSGDRDENRAEDQRQHDPPRDYLERTSGPEGEEEQREKPPQPVRASGKCNACTP